MFEALFMVVENKKVPKNEKKSPDSIDRYRN